MEVNIHQAKTHFSKLLQRVENGEEITIARAGKAIATIIPKRPQSGVRPMGMDRGRIWMADDFDAPDPEIEALFYDAPFTTNEAEAKPARKKKKK
jgi:prevent-host-death family protein